MKYSNPEGSINLNELFKLAAGLHARGKKVEVRSLHGGAQVLVYNDENEREWDAVCHSFSYGGDRGLIEIMGGPVEDSDDVEGYLTADEILARIDREES